MVAPLRRNDQSAVLWSYALPKMGRNPQREKGQTICAKEHCCCRCSGQWLPLVLAVATLIFPPADASAQTSTQASGAPPIAQADNAYGLRVGNEEIGLYDGESIRGFALDAGANYRLDGAYIASVAARSERTEASVAIHAGPNLFAARFPSPTGVVDLLTDHEPTPRANLILRSDGFGTVETVGRLATTVSGGALWAAGELKRERQYHGGRNQFDYGAVGGDVARGGWRVRGGVSVGRYRDSIAYAIFPAVAPADLPTYDRFRATPPPWTAAQGHEILAWGSVERALGNDWVARASLVHGRYTTDREAFVFLDGVDAGGRGELGASVFGRTKARASSGELLLERNWTARHGPARISVALLGRDQRAALAPATDLTLGLASINERIYFPDPGAPPGTAANDLIREGRIAASGSYPLTRWLLLSGSLQRVNYTKAYAPEGETAPRRTDREWAGHAAATVALNPRLSIYGAWVTGLEESGTAPAIAVNANETLPALRATQLEAGARYQLAEGSALIVSAFDIQKGAPGFDPGGVWRLNGTRRHRGVEASLVTALGPVQMVAGALYLDAGITEADGKRAEVVGQPRWRGSINAQWQATARLAIDAGAYLLGDAPARRDGAASIPARADLSLGATWTLGAGEKAPTLRVSASNLLDNRGWNANDDESLFPIETRAVRASLAFNW
jgi:iron complex outermembrane receptor protein